MKIALNIILLLLILCSCKNGNKTAKNIEFIEDYNSYIIDVSKTKNHKNFRKKIEEITFIPLETNDVSLLAEVTEVTLYKNKFYVLDKRYSSLKVFNKLGKYINSIGALGHGPGEFTTLWDFELDPESEKLLLLGHNEKAVFEYDLEGDYIKTIRNNLWASTFVKTDDFWFYYINHNDNSLTGKNNLIVLDNSGKIKDRLFPFSKDLNIMLGDEGIMFENNEGFLYSSALSDTIFQLHPDREMYPKYIFDFGENALPEEARNSINKLQEVQLEHSFLQKYFVESKDMIVFTYFDKGKRVTAFCHKENNLNSNKNISPVQIDFPIAFGLPVGLTDSNKIISFIEVEWFLNWLENGKISMDDLKRDYPDLYNIIPTLESTDNPILVTYKIKTP
ncbi:6-bladed beta-propeller [Sinomicrobium sp. M5D2P17]